MTGFDYGQPLALFGIYRYKTCVIVFPVAHPHTNVGVGKMMAAATKKNRICFTIEFMAGYA